ncbi:MAG: hypothetical protein AB7N76_29070 [Planctomycetota bacterium]
MSTESAALTAEVRALARAGRAPDALRLAFAAVQQAERERSGASEALDLAAAARWDEAVARCDVLTVELDRLTALLALLILALDPPASLGAAERVLAAISTLPPGSYDPWTDFDPDLAIWLAGRACELELARPERLLSAIPAWAADQASLALVRDVTGEPPEPSPWSLPWPTARALDLQPQGACQRLRLCEHLVETLLAGRSEQPRCRAELARARALLGQAELATVGLTRALEETSRLDAEDYGPTARAHRECVSSLARACAALEPGPAASSLLRAVRAQADRIAQAGERSQALQSLAFAAACAREPELARSLWADAEAPGWPRARSAQAEVLVALALDAARGGDIARAASCLDEAWAAAQLPCEPRWDRDRDRQLALLCVARGWASAGDPGRARACLGQLQAEHEPGARDPQMALAFRAGARACARAGACEVAEDFLVAARRALELDARDDGSAVASEWLALGRVPEALAALGGAHEAALVGASQRGYDHPLLEVLGVCGRLPSDAGLALIDSLIETAARFGEPAPRRRALSGIALALARLGAARRAAETLLAAIPAPEPDPTESERLLGLAALAGPALRAGDPLEAEATLRAALARAAAWAPAPTWAEAWSRAEALTEVVNACAEAAPDGVRIALLERALRAWTGRGAEGPARPALEAFALACARVEDSSCAARLLEHVLGLDPVDWVGSGMAALVPACAAHGAATLQALADALDLVLHEEGLPGKCDQDGLRLTATRAVLAGCVAIGDLPLVTPLLERVQEVALFGDPRVWCQISARAEALTEVAGAFAQLGAHDRALDLLRRVLGLARRWRGVEDAAASAFGAALSSLSATLARGVADRRRADLSRLDLLSSALEPTANDELPAAWSDPSLRLGGLDANLFAALVSACSHLEDARLRERALEALEAGCGSAPVDQTSCEVLCALTRAWARLGRPAAARRCLQRAIDLAVISAGDDQDDWCWSLVSGATLDASHLGVELDDLLRHLLEASPGLACLAALARCAAHASWLLPLVQERIEALGPDAQLSGEWLAVCETALGRRDEGALISRVAALPGRELRLDVVAALARGVADRGEDDLTPLLDLLAVEPTERAAVHAVARAMAFVAGARGDAELLACLRELLG